ncbi:MAG: indole-3-glycerol phosphate synthase TrpC [Acetobacteraceae bacterium]|nr:indole-3-glycerol phosphate synthase TrpC [Acetobacteraceae bacterium]
MTEIPDVLARICADTVNETARRKLGLSHAALDKRIAALPPARGFAASLGRKIAAGGMGLITEIKRASPSGGAIRPNFDAGELAAAYQSGGPACLSVLTDLPYFHGTEADLAAARAGCTLPALRKDFMLDPWQIHESRAMGADCVLLIMAVLSDAQAAELESIAMGLGMDVLVESHDAAELDRSLRLKTRMIGINNRNLKTLMTDIATTEQLAPRVPADRVVVGESGLKTHADLIRLTDCGVQRFLVGESLLRQPDLVGATRGMLGAA